MSALPTPSSPDRSFDLPLWSHKRLAHVEQALSHWVGHGAPAGLGDAMRYAVLDGGKRLRPLLVLAAHEAVCGGKARATFDAAALRAACAVELIHAYSLVHDDMPCMDDDVLRRGKPTVHVRFGQAQALLAGDALQALAFELLTPDDGAIPAATQAALCRLLARAAGSGGMAGGQAIDLISVGAALTEDRLRQMHRLKTGALLQGSVLMGAICGHADPIADPTVYAALSDYGAAMGLAFQVVDDILDVVADSATLGKTAGKDAAAAKPTYVSLLGLDRAQAQAQELLEQAHAALARSGLPDARALAALADMLVRRSC
ncbi:polyprenyl synthetase family protein [Verminephrobacter aporrectodeae subsp. tuberculatae]|uniref:Polyprenyl synthetase family protein n=1 Tax=Verminephrobacter aporrectodeae subsp. tuberculatae TaxID=1110392 RepID=A0ABT3KV39_9BURK|nr:farnesyl diphosphate synthase [Verminephrobacter aporrectodeae]MCW5223148.1 polyprenyl synthetase family protein [Verminephrobacter aporrectodeae subsp. tuberculatae]MCW5256634.1 polyprenyl synthetase family protein [Verminephrobacter aporrectodeae subsp. tuberculatae]MCW5288612.1 polyprenyl synthetase family protein [Verminephrobacter aporrectodeae subsp. tuberculatae]MCW5322201.1 polyprenyl synthetase family protein [Verminephrobacter aporrectodeae subsp. tuberculatae]